MEKFAGVEPADMEKVSRNGIEKGNHHVQKEL
jgi:hypothetical protein